MAAKICSKCKIEKSVIAFHKSCKAKDDLQDWCKICKIEYHQSFIGKKSKKKSSKKYNQSDKGKVSHRRCNKNRYKKYPEKCKAAGAVQYAIKVGKLHQPTHCEKCGGKKFVEGHHSDYEKLLKVEWLCFDCHKEVHKIDKEMG